LDPPDKASDRPLMRPVTVALSSLPRHETDLRSIAMTARPWAGGAKREVGIGPAARGSAASGCEGNEPHQRWVRAPDASRDRVTERYELARYTATNTMRSMVWGAGESSRWCRSSATSQGRHPTNRATPEKQGRWC